VENTSARTCLVGEYLCQVQASIESKETYTSFLKGFKEIISGLVENPFDEKYTIISKDNEALSPELLEIQTVKGLLMVLGYTEEESGFVYKVSDENMTKLQSCIEIIDNYLSEEKTTSLSDISDTKLELSIELSESDQSISREEKSCSSLKELFLAKHLKKEHSDDMMGARKRETTRLSDFSFNTNGYFQQSSSNRDARRNKCFRRELFHQQDHTTKGLGSSGFHVKRI